MTLIGILVSGIYGFMSTYGAYIMHTKFLDFRVGHDGNGTSHVTEWKHAVYESLYYYIPLGVFLVIFIFLQRKK